MRNAGRIATLAFTTLVVCSPAAHADAADPVAQYHAANQAFIQEFHRSGAHDPAILAQNLRALESIAAAGGGELRARALLELGFIHRVSNQFAPAAAAYSQAAAIAVPLGRKDIAFDAWIGLARTRALSKDHGAAAAALEHAMAAAGPQPTPKQHFEIALDTAEFADDRGEIEAALAGSLEALQQAPGPEDRLTALRQVDDVLLELVEECDYRRLRDSRTNADPPGKEWGGCRRAISVGEATSTSVARAADALGWKAMARMAGELTQQFQTRRALIDSLEANELPDPRRFPQNPEVAQFTPRDSRDVLVHRGEFARKYLAVEMPSSILTAQLRTLIERTVAEATSAQGRNSPGNLELRAQIADTPGGGATSQGTDLLTQAAHLMMAERTSFFDARRRGTVLERQAGIFTELALRLLALHQDDAAFAVLELTRARGLAELAQWLARDNIPPGDRAWLARQVKLDAEANAVADKVVENVVGEGSLAAQGEVLSQWERRSDEQRLNIQGHRDFRDRLAQTSFVPANLADLQRAATRAGIPVLLYWVANPNVYAWYVGPHGSDFRIIFLPRAALRQKIASLKAMRDPSVAFDAAAARHLYLYLIAPFDDLLDSNQLIIVPQGDMIDLPFEALIEPRTGQFLIERRVVSYALNATLAVHSLTRPVPSIRHVTAIIDPAIDGDTHEFRSIRSVGGLDLHRVDASDIDLDTLRNSLRGAESAHILMHGAFRAAEPVLSTLSGTLQSTDTAMSAADLLSIPMRGTKLVVMSACESGELGHRVSNEVYGFPWAVLAAGAENVVTSRWLVSGASNSLWMGTFYGALSSGASPAQAAAAAVRAMLKTDRGKPYYWAAMQVTGR